MKGIPTRCPQMLEQSLASHASCLCFVPFQCSGSWILVRTAQGHGISNLLSPAHHAFVILHIIWMCSVSTLCVSAGRLQEGQRGPPVAEFLPCALVLCAHVILMGPLLSCL